MLYSESGYNQTAIIAIIDQALEDLPSDIDEDGFDVDIDNCPEIYNPTQADIDDCLLYTSPSPRDLSTSRMPSSA